MDFTAENAVNQLEERSCRGWSGVEVGREHLQQKAAIYRSCNSRKRPSSRCEHLICEQGRVLQGEGVSVHWKSTLLISDSYRVRATSGIHESILPSRKTKWLLTFPLSFSGV